MIDFNNLYNLVKSNTSIYSSCIKSFEDFADNFALSENKTKYRFKTFDKKLGLCADVTRVCYNNCDGCSFPANGKKLDINLVKPLMDKIDFLSLTGGEALLHPDLGDLLNAFSEHEPKSKVLSIITGGLNTSIKQDIKDLYYYNLNEVIKSSKLIKKIDLGFSYFGGTDLDARTLDFFKNLLKIYRNHNLRNNILFNARIIYDEDAGGKAKLDSFFNIFRTHGFNDDSIHKLFVNIQSVKELKLRRDGFFNYTSSCIIENVLNVDVDGNVMPCCSNHASIKPLFPIAHVNENFDTIIDKRNVFLGLFRLFQKNANSCNLCTHSFPLFMEKMKENIEQVVKQ